jgi:hypothetical protein
MRAVAIRQRIRWLRVRRRREVSGLRMRGAHRLATLALLTLLSNLRSGLGLLRSQLLRLEQLHLLLHLSRLWLPLHLSDLTRIARQAPPTSAWCTRHAALSSIDRIRSCDGGQELLLTRRHIGHRLTVGTHADIASLSLHLHLPLPLPLLLKLRLRLWLTLWTGSLTLTLRLGLDLSLSLSLSLCLCLSLTHLLGVHRHLLHLPLPILLLEHPLLSQSSRLLDFSLVLGLDEFPRSRHRRHEIRRMRFVHIDDSLRLVFRYTTGTSALHSALANFVDSRD